MDLNYYLHREQIERVRACQAGQSAAAEAHRGLADLYRQRIKAYRDEKREEPMPRLQA